MDRAPECRNRCQYAIDVQMWPEHQCADECQYRVVRCDACGSEGRILRGQYEDEYDDGPCPACEGTGEEIVEVEPIDQDDLIAMGGFADAVTKRRA
jgi:ssDNA-binding Zn-finger/Zn-ribbon topoisomerase 1